MHIVWSEAFLKHQHWLMLSWLETANIILNLERISSKNYTCKQLVRTHCTSWHDIPAIIVITETIFIFINIKVNRYIIVHVFTWLEQ